MLQLADVLPIHRSVAGRFADHLGTVDDGQQPVPHLGWTVGELGAHVLSVLRAYRLAVTDDVPMWPDAHDGAGGNQALLDRTPEREPAELAAAIPTALDELQQALTAHGGADVPSWGDIRVAPVVLPAMQVGDIAVHGWDLSQATGRPWRIERQEALTTVEAMFHVVPHYVRQDAAEGFRATYEITLRGGGSWTARFEDGTLDVAPGRAGRPDCRLLSDPVAFLLLAYRRVPLWRPSATGKAIAYGRRPWLALKFLSLLDSP